MPPRSQILPEVEPAVGEGELPLMDQEPRVGAAGDHVVLDLVERHHQVAGVGLEQPQRQIRGGQLSGDGDSAPGQGVARVAPLRDVYLTLYIPLSDVSRVNVGQSVDVRTDAYPGKTFAALSAKVVS